jgi:hypothetical protein
MRHSPETLSLGDMHIILTIPVFWAVFGRAVLISAHIVLWCERFFCALRK